MGLLRRVIWRVLPPFELEVTIDEVRAFIKEHAPYSRSHLDNALSSLWKESENIVYSIRFEGRSPHVLALLIVADMLYSQVTSGRYHFYLDHLNTNGIEMLKAWALAVDLLVENSHYDESQALELKSLMKERLSQVG